MSSLSGKEWITMCMSAHIVLAKDHVEKPEDDLKNILDGWNQNRPF